MSRPLWGRLWERRVRGPVSLPLLSPRLSVLLEGRVGSSLEVVQVSEVTDLDASQFHVQQPRGKVCKTERWGMRRHCLPRVSCLEQAASHRGDRRRGVWEGDKWQRRQQALLLCMPLPVGGHQVSASRCPQGPKPNCTSLPRAPSCYSQTLRAGFPAPAPTKVFSPIRPCRPRARTV